MKPKTLLVLTVLTLGLGAFIFFYEKDLPSTDERRDLDAKLLPVTVDDVTSLEIRWDDQAVRLERTAAEDGADEGAADAWRLVAPVDAGADAAAVRGTLDRLAALQKGRGLAGIDRADGGLDAPRVTVVLGGEDGERRLELGAEVPVSGDSVVAVDEGIYQAAFAPDLLEELTQGADGWRDRRLFSAPRADIKSLTLSADGAEATRLVRRGDAERFDLAAPVQDLADSDAVAGLLTTLVGLEAAAFVDGDGAGALGLDPPRGVLEVTLGDEGTPFRIELGDAVTGSEGAAALGETRVYARVGGQPVELEAAPLEVALARSADAWRSRDWTSQQVFGIERAVLEDAAGAVRLRREGGEWWRGENDIDEERIDYSKASDVLYPVTEAKAERLVSRGEAAALGYDLAAETLSIHFTSEDGDERLRLHGEAEGLWAATDDGRPGIVLLLGPAKVDELRTALGALRAAEPLPEIDPAQDGQGTSVDGTDGDPS
ncbi:MAG: DUF4340 domain-containing protein [Acidobacteriota bacterium]